MSKFSTFLVFVFGVFVLIAVAVIVAQKRLFPVATEPPEEKVVLPVCNLPALEIGTRDQFGVKLSKMATTGGLEAVKDYVVKEIVPGRALVTADSATDPMAERWVLDREVRRCDAEGVAPLDKPPLVPRASSALRAGGKVQIQNWSRLDGPQPFVVTIWWVPSAAK